MTNSPSIATVSTDTSSVKKVVSEPSSTTTTTTTPATIATIATTTPEKSSKTSWRERLHISSKPEQPGKETWRDASLSEEERWKAWQKAKDKEEKKGSVTGTFSEFYTAKGWGKWGYWIAT